MLSLVSYDSLVKRLSLLATGLVLAALVVPSLSAQINGIPPLVTSLSNGRTSLPPVNIGPSVTSLGPRGFRGGGVFFGATTHGFGGPAFEHNPRMHFRVRTPFVGVVPVAVPIAVPVAVPVWFDSGMGYASYETDPSENNDSEVPGQTVFEHRRTYVPRVAGYDREYDDSRGNAASERQASKESDAQVAESVQMPAPPPAPEAPQPTSILVFLDGHKIEVTNYAILGDTLYDLTPGHPRKIALAMLDLNATEKLNSDRGLDFNVPATKGE